jgi:4-carboxymuconolactone decarboxylase
MRNPDKTSLKHSWSLLIQVSATLASGRYKELARLFGQARKQRIPAVRLYEIVLQCYLFLGFPKAIEGLKLLRRHFPDFDPPPPERPDPAAMRLWKERGEALCRKTYGSNYDSLREILGRVSPDLDEWMVWEGYGKVLSRKGVPPVVRELCTCAALVVTGDDVQLHSHIRGAIHAGASPEMLRETLDLADGAVTSKRHRQATMLLENILTKAGRNA